MGILVFQSVDVVFRFPHNPSNLTIFRLPRTRHWQASRKPSSRRWGGNPNRHFSTPVISETLPSICTAHVPQVPMPRQWNSPAAPLYSDKFASSSTRRRLAPSSHSMVRLSKVILGIESTRTEFLQRSQIFLCIFQMRISFFLVHLFDHAAHHGPARILG